MHYGKKIGLISLLAFLIAIASLGIGYSTLNTTLEINGIAKVAKKEYKTEINNIHDIQKINNEMMSDPIINGKQITTKVTLSQVGQTASFMFDIENLGNVDSELENITITGYENYRNYLDLKIEGFKNNELIKASSKKEHIKVTINYKNALLDEFGLPQIININELKIDVLLKEVKKGE